MVVLSYVQVRPWLTYRNDQPTRLNASLDLGLSDEEVVVTPDGILLPHGAILSWPTIEEIAANETACYAIEDGDAWKIQFFSQAFNRLYTLMPTEKAPTMLISGIPMHRIKDINPYQDTLRKIKTLTPVAGDVLDTATGLGYTAIQAAQHCEHVITVELDPIVLEVCRLNPWSQALFDNPKIEQRIGDVYDEVETFADKTFARIIHDPPMFSLAGHLYSADFYRQLHRILKPRGRLFHYVGDPKSKSGGNITRGVARRLREVGFHRIEAQPQAFGVVAHK